VKGETKSSIIKTRRLILQMRDINFLVIPLLPRCSRVVSNESVVPFKDYSSRNARVSLRRIKRKIKFDFLDNLDT
jgi:hypothetical protein